MVAPEGRKQWPDVAVAHLTECYSNPPISSHHTHSKKQTRQAGSLLTVDIQTSFHLIFVILESEVAPDTKMRGSLLAVTSASMPTRGGMIPIPKNRDSSSYFPIHNSTGRRNLNS